MNKFQKLFREITEYRKAPEMISLWIILSLIAVLLIINIFFLPSLLRGLTIILFLGISYVMTLNNLRLARTNLETKAKRHELQSVIQNLQDGVISYNTNFKILTFNKAAEKILDISAEEIIDQKIDPALSKNPHFRRLTQIIFPSLAPAINQISEANVWPQIIDISFEEPTLEIRTALSPITDSKDNILGYIKVLRDQTREKNILKSKSEFISIAAHQLRTPLTAINWTFESLTKLSEAKPELKNIIEEGHSTAQRALKIINDLLDVSKIEEGKFDYTFEDTNLIEFIQTVLNNFKPIAEQYGVNIYFQKPEKPIQVQLDLQKMSIALSNLIDNAIKYNSKNGKVTISVEKIEKEPYLKIKIEDTGVGIPPQEINKLFKKFYRGSNVIQLQPDGSGLGLYVTKNIIQRHGGQIGVESVIDRGSTFYFTLPLKLEPKSV